MCRLCTEHPTVLRTGSSFRGCVFEEFHFPQCWSSLALAQVSASHFGFGWSNRVLATLVCPLSIGATTAPQDPSAWVFCRACWQSAPPRQMWARPQLAKEASPSLTAEMHGWGNQTCAVTRSPLADIPQKPKKQAQSSFAQVKNNLQWGRESPV